MADTGAQLDLFQMDHVLQAYEGGSVVDNNELYEHVRAAAGVSQQVMEARQPIGASGQHHSVAKRRVRWMQQTARRLGLLERVPERRGAWRLTEEGKRRTGKAAPGVALLAFSTDLGLAIWGSWESVFPRLDEKIVLCLTSPPYPLRKPRAYGNPPIHLYVDFIVKALEPIVRNLADGGSIALNLSNDIFEAGLPSRELYLERLTLALCDTYRLHKMDTLIWSNPSKPPGPVRWASMTRQQLNVSWEPILWLTNNPRNCVSDNRRILEPHSDRHQRLMARGGEHREAVNSDGAYRIHQGSYGRPTDGRIARNVLMHGHRCAEAQACNHFAAEQGLAPHGAPMPLALADKLVRFLSRPDDLVADPFGGRLTTGKAAEQNGRRRICTELIADHLHSALPRFPQAVPGPSF
ncbi:site-specific DNA-methyltransferase [Xanthomonas arboricola]|uniref:Methyltransferase n=1 Tax=Xanthomonas arboricola TaxID=56448 RepID=A0AB73H290_9XANT|nr:site-specific DNA-methyltransferase [Xanthomonas arboricola]MBB5672271.1 site-specific DNA-methyltransferase (cytosine-N4-specific) [Xanthomonas arboricola]